MGVINILLHIMRKQIRLIVYWTIVHVTNYTALLDTYQPNVEWSLSYVSNVREGLLSCDCEGQKLNYG